MWRSQLKSASVGCGFYRSKSVGCGFGFVGARSKYNLIPSTLKNLKKLYLFFLKLYFAADFYERLWYCLVWTRFILTISVRLSADSTWSFWNSKRKSNPIRRKTGLQIHRIRICEKVTESVGFEIEFEIRHIPKINKTFWKAAQNC